MQTIIFANGIINPATAVRELLKAAEFVIAADGGARHCLALELTPDVLIGDFDSLTPAEIARLEAAGAELIRHPARKDHTDLELALAHAAARGATAVTILGGLGGRLDQTAASLLLPASPDRRKLSIRLVDGRQSARVLHGPGSLDLAGRPGDTLSLLALAGDAIGITTSGLEYPLQNQNLAFGSSHGISNALIGERAELRLEAGLLLVVQIEGLAGEE
ncbi:MAG: thiamine diphosphokinase [Anaerolineales bacterium]|nr:thiamine diphosphokinase [Anaerolineales bacterium]